MAEPPLSRLSKLQPELQLMVVSHVWQQDLINWSSTSSNFRSLLAPYIFTSVTLRNTEKSGFSVDLIAKSNYRQYVRDFSFEGTAPGDEEDGFTDTEEILPDVVESVLSNLSQFPTLESVRIEFPLDFCDGWGGGQELFHDDETPEKRVRDEGEEAWRALNTKVYAALARNINPSFKKLTLEALLPREASSFSTPEFKALLGQMTHFTLSCWTDDDSHYRTVTRYGCVYYTERFDTLFFNHLTSVTHLSISGVGMPMGALGGSLKLNRFQMPLLRSLHLEGIFICRELVEFLTSHAQTLEILHLDDCHAAAHTFGDQSDCITWDDLFTPLSNSKPTRICEFRVEPDGTQLCHEIELFDDYRSSKEIKDEAARALEHLKTHPERRLFAYSYIDDKYGFVGGDKEGNLQSFRAEIDQRAFDRLMGIVERNAAKAQRRKLTHH